MEKLGFLKIISAQFFEIRKILIIFLYNKVL